LLIAFSFTAVANEKRRKREREDVTDKTQEESSPTQNGFERGSF